MADVQTQESNSTGLRIAEEASPRVLPATPVWNQYEPNSYPDFGAEITKVARNPINDSRQQSKGVTTDLDAAGGFVTDLTQDNLQDILQGLVLADFRRKGEEIVLDIDGTTESFEVGDTAGFYVGSLVLSSGNDTASNDGVKRVTAITPDVHASATLDADADSFTANDTITIDGVTYTFVASVDETTAAYSVLLSGTTAQNLTRLISAINGTGAQAVDYGIGTAAHTTVTAAEAAGDTLTVTSIVGGAAGNAIAVSKVTTDTDIVWGTANLAGGANGTITVAEDLATETPSGSPTLVVVGFQFASADATIDASGVLPTLSATAKDLTELGLIPGEPIFIGGDLAAEQFATSADNGFKRVRSVTATDITLDKSDDTLVTDAGSGKTLRVFFGRVLKNEARVLRVRRTYQLERTLGAPDDSSTDEQAEYLTGSLFNEFAINVPQAEKITCDATFLSMDQEFRESWEGLKTGTRPDLEDADAFNTSTDFSRIKLARVSSVDEAPEPLFAYATALTLNVSNNGSLNKAIGTLGGIGINIGSLTVGGSIEAYFADVAAVSAVRNNDDITLDFAIVRNNAGLFIDLPLLALSGGQLTVEQDQPIKVPLEMQAARGRKVDPDMDHTILLSFFDYLPDLADE